MALTNAYCTVAEIKTYLGISDTNDDTALEYPIDAASRAIDKFCRRRFWLNGTVEDRYYTAEWGDVLVTDDIATTTGLAIVTDEDGDRTYERTWASTDYDLYPYNSITEAPDEPYTEIHNNSHTGLYTFPVGIPKGVKVTAKFGWATVPLDVRQACFVLSSRLWHRRNAPFSTVGSPELGETTIRRDNDLKDLLMPYRRMSVGAV